MARKKRSSPYDDEAGRGTGEFHAARAAVPPPPAAPGGADATAAGGTLAVSPLPATPIAPPQPDAPNPYDGIPDSGLLGALISVVFFFPIGIFAVSAALQVRSRWKRGDRNGARAAAERSERLTYAAIGCFIVLAVLVALGYFIYWFTGPRTRR